MAMNEVTHILSAIDCGDAQVAEQLLSDSTAPGSPSSRPRGTRPDPPSQGPRPRSPSPARGGMR